MFEQKLLDSSDLGNALQNVSPSPYTVFLFLLVTCYFMGAFKEAQNSFSFFQSNKQSLSVLRYS